MIQLTPTQEIPDHEDYRPVYRLLVVHSGPPAADYAYYDVQDEPDALKVLAEAKSSFPDAQFALGVVIRQRHPAGVLHGPARFPPEPSAEPRVNIGIHWIHGMGELNEQYGHGAFHPAP